MANTTLTTITHRTNGARAFISDVGATPYYFFTADHTLPENSSLIDPVVPSVNDSLRDVYRNMIYGKRIGSNSVSLAIRNLPYETGVVYTMYDDSVSLESNDYYVCVNASSYFHVFKVLDNNQNAASTIPPNFADIVGSNTHIYQTSDGYRWKYMYSFDSAQNLKYTTSEFIPVVANADVSGNAVPGSIDVVKIIEPGRGYSNYLTGSLNASDIMVNGQTTVYAISNTVAKTQNGFYTGCYIYLTTGEAAGQYREIVDYVSNPNGNFITVESFFEIEPTNGTNYEIYPKVTISGSGSETVPAAARALVNAVASNSIYRVEMLDYGRDYQYATAEIIANGVVGVLANAEVRPILPPKNGHGYDAASELGCRDVIISTSLANNEGNTVPAVNTYRRVGIVKEPVFSEATLTMINQTGSYLIGETIRQITSQRVKFNVVAALSNTGFTANTGDFREQLSDGQPIMIRNDDTSSYFYTTIDEVINSSAVSTIDALPFSASNASIFTVNTVGTAIVSNTGLNSLLISNVSPTFISGSKIIGQSSGAFSEVDTVSRSGVTKGFDTYVQLNKYVGSLSFGLFSINEPVTQGNSVALLHSYQIDSGVTTAYTSNQVGQFTTGNTMIGTLSSAIMSISAKYQPELVFGSGVPIYIENLSPISRAPTQTETFKTVLHF